MTNDPTNTLEQPKALDHLQRQLHQLEQQQQSDHAHFVANALAFMKKVQATVTLNEYALFRTELASYTVSGIDKDDVVSRVRASICAYPKLVDEFAVFVGASSPTSTISNADTGIQQQPQSLSLDTTMLRNTDVPGWQHQNRPPSPNETRESFKAAYAFMDTVKHAYSSTPQTYRRFMEILQSHRQRGVHKDDVVRQVSVLFGDRPDLFDGFCTFLRYGVCNATTTDDGGSRQGDVHDLEYGGDGRVQSDVTIQNDALSMDDGGIAVQPTPQQQADSYIPASQCQVSCTTDTNLHEDSSTDGENDHGNDEQSSESAWLVHDSRQDSAHACTTVRVYGTTDRDVCTDTPVVVSRRPGLFIGGACAVFLCVAFGVFALVVWV